MHDHPEEVKKFNDDMDKWASESEDNEMNDYIFKIANFSGWAMQIYVDVFFPCTQRELLKVIKLVKESENTTSEYRESLLDLLKKVQLYYEELAPEYEHEKLNKNEALIVKKINEIEGVGDI